MPAEAAALQLELSAHGRVSALLDAPTEPRACYVFAHGAGAGMDHEFMAAVARGLAQRGVAVLRFNFPFMEAGTRRPDTAPVAQATVRAAVAEAARRFPGVALFAGGKSFGGRMTTQAQAAGLLAGVQGIVLVGFPLHPAGKPGTQRAAHLSQVTVPMLFLQGTRDSLAELPLMRDTAAGLGARATLHVVEGADHGFHVLVRSGRTDAQVVTELCDTAAAWMLAPPAMG